MTFRPDGTRGKDDPGSRDPVGRLIELAGPRPSIPTDRAERVRVHARAAWRSGVRRRRRVVALGLGVAAAVLVIGIPRVRESVSPGHRPAVRIEASHGPLRWTGDALETGDRGRAAVRLSGGVAVRLDTGTRLRFPTERVVVLERGAAYVILESGGRGAGDPAGPILRTSFGDVRHLGTRFEARLEDGALRLRVRDGQVRVGEGRAVVHAAATEEILVGPAGLLDRRRVALHGPVWGWTLAIAPAFHLEGRTLAELLTWIVEETGWRLEYHDPVLARRAGRIVLHGSLEHVAPDQALSIVAPTVGISFRVEDGVLEIGR